MLTLICPTKLLLPSFCRITPVFLIEPPPTRYDLHFTFFGVPVRVHPLFWVLSVVLGAARRGARPKDVVIWIIAVFVSFLIHEFGHALAIRYYGWRPRIILYSFGGLAAYEPTYHNRLAQIIIAFAGPLAGFLLAGAVLAATRATGHDVRFYRSLFHPVDAGPFASGNLQVLVNNVLYLNIFWGLINLLPIFPLDGGKIAQETLVHFNPRGGLRQSLLISMITAIGVGLALFARSRDFFPLMLFVPLAYTNFQMLQQYGDTWGGRGW